MVQAGLKSRPSSKPCQSVLQFGSPGARFFQTLTLLPNHLFLGTGEEIRIIELGMDFGYIAVDPTDLLLQARFLGRDVDNALEQQGGRRAARDNLNRPLRSRCRETDGADAGNALERIAMDRHASLNGWRGAHHHQWDLSAAGNADF